MTIKALLLDMDETLCDTPKANEVARLKMAKTVESLYSTVNADQFSLSYLRGIYRDWTKAQKNRYMPIIEQESESAFRVQLICDLLAEQGETSISKQQAMALQDHFDHERLEAFDFYPGMLDFLLKARERFKLIVITNGPEFSQIPKVESVNLAQYVDHIIIGGQEPEQKPAVSIFNKALALARCQADEALHLGDSLAADIAGANNAGIKSIWIQHHQAVNPDITPTYTVEHPTQLPDLIANITG